jgi:hypothetical protein
LSFDRQKKALAEQEPGILFEHMGPCETLHIVGPALQNLRFIMNRVGKQGALAVIAEYLSRTASALDSITDGIPAVHKQWNPGWAGLSFVDCDEPCWYVVQDRPAPWKFSEKLLPDYEPTKYELKMGFKKFPYPRYLPQEPSSSSAASAASSSSAPAAAAATAAPAVAPAVAATAAPAATGPALVAPQGPSGGSGEATTFE